MSAFRQQYFGRHAAAWLLAGSLLLLFASRAPAQVTQYWDPGTGAGLQGTSTNAGWSTASNAWSSVSGGTTSPGTWTNGNDANFIVGSAATITATVFSISAHSITFGQTTGGRLILQPGSGALTNGAGGVSLINMDNIGITFNCDIVLSATQTWSTWNFSTDTITATGVVSGANAAIIKTGAGVVTLNNAANSFGGLIINNGTVTGTGGGTVLGTGPITLGSAIPSNGIAAFAIATLNVNAGAANTTTTISNLTISGGAVLQLNDQLNITNTLNGATLARQGTGTLVVIAANIGTRERINFVGGTNLVNGILAPWMVGSANNGDFLSNGVNGLTNATYTSSFGANNVVSPTSSRP